MKPGLASIAAIGLSTAAVFALCVWAVADVRPDVPIWQSITVAAIAWMVVFVIGVFMGIKDNDGEDK